jgi:hypothetical protein
MPGADNGAVVLVVECGAAEVNQPNVALFHPSHISLLLKIHVSSNPSTS